MIEICDELLQLKIHHLSVYTKVSVLKNALLRFYINDYVYRLMSFNSEYYFPFYQYEKKQSNFQIIRVKKWWQYFQNMSTILAIWTVWPNTKFKPLLALLHYEPL